LGEGAQEVLTREYGNIVFQCDDCGQVLVTNTEDFTVAQGRLQAEGWAARKVAREDWIHHCPGCRV